MSLESLPYKVENITTGSPVNITDNIVSIDSIKFQGTGRIRTGNIMLNADEGGFITSSDVGGVGVTPKLNQFDKLQFKFTDDNGLTKSLILELDQELGQKSSEGNLLPLELKGREVALQRIKVTAFFQFNTPKGVLEELRLRYNKSSKGILDPLVFFRIASQDFVNVPDNIVNQYDFTQEITYYDAMMQVITRLNQPVGQGGDGNFYSMIFEDREFIDGVPGLVMKVFIQGSGPTTPTIESTPDNPIHEINFQIHSQSGTQIFVRGQANTGYMPSSFHTFISFVEEINNLPAYDDAQVYPTGFRTRGGDNKIYEANTLVPINTPPPDIEWDLTNPATIIGPLNYSLFTKEKEVVTKNSCSNATTGFLVGGFNAPAFPDGNLVIREGFDPDTNAFVFWRDFTMIRTNNDLTIQSDPILRHYIFERLTVGIYKGFRVLVDTSLGAVGGRFVGNDKFGRPFADAAVQWDGTDWIVFRNPQVGDQICVLQEGIIREYNVPFTDKLKFGAAHKASKFRGTPGPLSWQDISDTAGGNDVFHHPQNIERAPGLFANQINDDDYSSFITDSAIKITFSYTLKDSINRFLSKFNEFFSDIFGSLISLAEGNFDDVFEPDAAAITETQTPSYYDFGWWYALPFPYPFNTLNNITEEMGDLYGGSAATAPEFAVLDLQNANFSPTGKRGLNHDEVSDMGGPFTGIHFYFNFDIFLVGQSRKPFVGDIKFTVTIYDDLSQVWRTDFSYRFLGDTQEIFLPFSSFTVDRPSRTPWGINTIISNIIVPELEIRSIFEQKRVRLIVFQLADSYDDNERFMPAKIENLTALLFNFVFSSLGIRFVGIIDALTLTKQPFVSSGVELNRVINSDTIQIPNIRNLRQLESIAIAQKDISGLQFEQFTVTTDGDCSLTTEQSVILKDQDMVKFSDVGPNTRKLVVMTEDFSFNANGQKSGFLVRRELTRRLNA